MRRLLMGTLGVLTCSAFACLSASPVSAGKNTAARGSAAYIYGAIAGTFTFLGQCGQADKQNAATYATAFDVYYGEVLPVLERINTILRTENERSALPKNSYLESLSEINRKGSEEITKMREDDPVTFILTCRALPVALQRHILAFAPLPERFPSQMRDIDEWK